MKLRLIFKQIFSCLQAKRKVVPFFDRSENDTVNIGGVDWAVLNAGTDEENPQGKLYSIEEAMLLENERWRLPTLEEVQDLGKHKRAENLKDENRGVWIIQSVNHRLFFPLNCVRKKDGFLPRLIGAYWTSTSFFDRKYIGQYIYEMEPYYTCAVAPKTIKVGVRMVRD
jgi:hypothetical protein